MYDKDNLPRELIQAAKENKLVIFVGSGLSAELKNTKGDQIGTWNNTITKLLEHLNITDIEREGKTPLQILTELEERGIEKTKIIPFIKYFYYLESNNNYDLHKSLFELSDTIITTNYDNAFERANINNVEVVSINKEFELYNVVTKNYQRKILIKLHGCVNDIGTLILFESDYDKLYKSLSEVQSYQIFTIITYLIMNYTTLFIGYGMEDFQIKNLFSIFSNARPNNTRFLTTSKNQIPNCNIPLIKISAENRRKDIQGIINKLIEEKSNANNA